MQISNDYPTVFTVFLTVDQNYFYYHNNEIMFSEFNGTLGKVSF